MTQTAKRKSYTKSIALTALSTALIAVCSQITVPFTIPFTMQTFAVFAVSALLGFKKGTASVLTYILLGAVGAPVFAGFSGGIGILFGMTGGYIIGFILSAMIIGIAADKFGTKIKILIPAMILGLALCYLFGTIWFMIVYTRTSGTIGVTTALSMCVVPFIIPDIAKSALAILVAMRLKKFI